MTQEQQFKNVEQLNIILEQYQKTGSAKISIEEKLMLKETYQSILGYVQMDLSCGSCQLQYLSVLASWYAREHPKYLATLEAAATPIISEAAEGRLVCTPDPSTVRAWWVDTPEIKYPVYESSFIAPEVDGVIEGIKDGVIDGVKPAPAKRKYKRKK